MKRILTRILTAALAMLVVVGTGTTAAQEADRSVVRPRTQAFTLLGGSGGYLGVGIADVDGDRADEAGMAEAYGVYVSEVVEDGPAAEAGVEEGDVIVRWNGDRVESAAQLQRLTRETPPGRTVDLTVFRAGGERTLEVELGDRADANRLAIGGSRILTIPRTDRVERITPRTLMRRDSRPSFVFAGRPRLGASIQSLGDQLADYFGVDGGALVTSVSENSPAEAAGLRAGDIIIEIAGESVQDPGDLLEVLSDQEAGAVSLTVVRDGSERTVTVELEEREEGGDWQDGDLRLFWDEGEDISIEPFTMEGFEVGPIEFEGFEMEPMEWDFDTGEYFGGEPMHISIPSIDIPGFEMPIIEMPEIEIPGFEMRVPRVEIRV